MKLRQAGDVVRAVSLSPRTTGSPSVQMECLRALRRELASTFPTVDVGALLRILRRHGLGEFPDALLLGGRLRDLSPDGSIARLRRAHDAAASRTTEWHPLFSNEFYEATNPDVARAGVPLWLHYAVHGRVEGRSPHPLVDVKYLAAAVPGARHSETLDTYLTHPENWRSDTSPYVDAGRFALEGPWDGQSNPLTQIVRENRGEPWVHGRLMVVDSGAREGAAARALGAAILLARSQAAANFSAISSWIPVGDSARENTAPARYVVVPGYFLASDGHELAATSGRRMSDDGTVIRLAHEVLSLASGPSVVADELCYLESELTRPEIVALLDRPGRAVAVAPFSAAQQFALEQIAGEVTAEVIVLRHGRQVSVDAGSRRVVRTPEAADAPIWAWPDDVPAGTVVVVVAESNRRRSTADPLVRAALLSGAALSIVGAHGIADWMPVLTSRAHVVVDRVLLQLVLGVVDTDRVWQLAGGEVGNQS